MRKVGMKFEMAKVSNKDGSPAIGMIRRINRFNVAFFQITMNGKSTFSSDSIHFQMTDSNEHVIVRNWV